MQHFTRRGLAGAVADKTAAVSHDIPGAGLAADIGWPNQGTGGCGHGCRPAIDMRHTDTQHERNTRQKIVRVPRSEAHARCKASGHAGQRLERVTFSRWILISSPWAEPGVEAAAHHEFRSKAHKQGRKTCWAGWRRVGRVDGLPLDGVDVALGARAAQPGVGSQGALQLRDDVARKGVAVGCQRGLAVEKMPEPNGLCGGELRQWPCRRVCLHEGHDVVVPEDVATQPVGVLLVHAGPKPDSGGQPDLVALDDHVGRVVQKNAHGHARELVVAHGDIAREVVDVNASHDIPAVGNGTLQLCRGGHDAVALDGGQLCGRGRASTCPGVNAAAVGKPAAVARDRVAGDDAAGQAGESDAYVAGPVHHVVFGSGARTGSDGCKHHCQVMRVCACGVHLVALDLRARHVPRVDAVLPVAG